MPAASAQRAHGDKAAETRRFANILPRRDHTSWDGLHRTPGRHHEGRDWPQAAKTVGPLVWAQPDHRVQESGWRTVQTYYSAFMVTTQTPRQRQAAATKAPTVGATGSDRDRSPPSAARVSRQQPGQNRGGGVGRRWRVSPKSRCPTREGGDKRGGRGGGGGTGGGGGRGG